MSKTERDIENKWKWPRFSLREVLALVVALALTLAPAAYGKQEGEAIFGVFGSLLLLWGYLCWKTVRLNPGFFTIWKRRSRD